MAEHIKLERYIGRRGDWFCTTDENRTKLYPCIHKGFQRGHTYYDPNWSQNWVDGQPKLNRKGLVFYGIGLLLRCSS